MSLYSFQGNLQMSCSPGSWNTKKSTSLLKSRISLFKRRIKMKMNAMKPWTLIIMLRSSLLRWSLPYTTNVVLKSFVSSSTKYMLSAKMMMSTIELQKFSWSFRGCRKFPQHPMSFLRITANYASGKSLHTLIRNKISLLMNQAT